MTNKDRGECSVSELTWIMQTSAGHNFKMHLRVISWCNGQSVEARE